jgi:type II restriction enzyme
MAGENVVKSITDRLPALGAEQLAVIDTIVSALLRPATFERKKESDLVTEGVLREFGDILRIHHVFSEEPFTKDRFEYALQKACNSSGIEAKRAPRGNPGHDLTIKETAFSLKTEASAGIRRDRIHISKFMELGQGVWSDKEADLIGLRDRFFNHMKSYQRILTLRRLPETGSQFYELVEIPKALLELAVSGKLEMRMQSKQMPKPGYCTVTDQNGRISFQLYFDGGTERKLQIKDLKKDLCTVHATWKFPVNEPVAL